MSDDLEGADFDLLKLFAPRQSSTARGRKKLERKRSSSGDGRSLRKSGRTAQMNIKVRPDFRAEIEAAARERGILMVELIEQAWEALKQREKI